LPSIKRKREERAHQYRVIAERLEFHLTQTALSDAVAAEVRKAKQSLLFAAALLDSCADEPGEAGEVVKGH
jgi:hypothetical protein